MNIVFEVLNASKAKLVALLEADPEELRARLQFLKPGLELAKTHDESVLANLPEDERKIAREIARSLEESGRPPLGQPLP